NCCSKGCSNGRIGKCTNFINRCYLRCFCDDILVNILKKDVQPVTIQTEDGLTVSENESADVPEEENQAKEESEEVEINKLTDITNFDLIDIDLAGTTQNDVIDELVRKLDGSGVLASDQDFKQAILNREKESTTGMGMNIAIPHGKSNA